MKKIMFSDRFGMTQAVKDEIKNNTRRVAKDICHSLVSHVSELHNIEVGRDGFTITYSTGVRQHVFPAYQVGEEVAVAQSYKVTAQYSRKWLDLQLAANAQNIGDLFDSGGWENKMYVSAYYCPLRIRITNIRFERLQDISNEDCLREGIHRVRISGKAFSRPVTCYTFNGDTKPMPTYMTPKEAFAALIDEINGKGTWEKNPWVFVYEFELVK